MEFHKIDVFPTAVFGYFEKIGDPGKSRSSGQAGGYVIQFNLMNSIYNN